MQVFEDLSSIRTSYEQYSVLWLQHPGEEFELFLRQVSLIFTPYTLHPALHTLHSTPYTLHPAPYTLHPTACTLHPTPYTLNPKP